MFSEGVNEASYGSFTSVTIMSLTFVVIVRYRPPHLVHLPDSFAPSPRTCPLSYRHTLLPSLTLCHLIRGFKITILMLHSSLAFHVLEIEQPLLSLPEFSFTCIGVDVQTMLILSVPYLVYCNLSIMYF